MMQKSDIQISIQTRRFLSWFCNVEWFGGIGGEQKIGNLRMINKTTAWMVCASFLLSGCIAHYQVDPHVYICESSGSVLELPARDNGTSKDMVFRILAEINEVDKPISMRATYIRITAFNVDRRHFWQNRWNIGVEPVPMLYSANSAFIMADGNKIKADPRIYLSRDDNGHYPGKALYDDTVDLNSDFIHIRPKRGLSIYGNVFIRFDIPPLAPGTQGLLHLGEIKLGPKVVTIPDFHLCTNTGSSRWAYSPIRP